MMEVVAATLYGRVVLGGPVKEQQRRRHRERLELGLEARQERPRIGRKIRKPKNHAATVEITRRFEGTLRAIAYASKFRPMIRTRKKATMLAITTATNPPAEAFPTSNWISACE